MKYIFVILTFLLSQAALAEYVEVKTVEQAKKVLKSGKPMVVMLGADWCGACKGALPHFKKAAEFYGDKVVFAYFNEVGIKGLNYQYIPAYAAGKNEKDLRSGKSLNKNEGRFVPGILEFTKKYTGVKYQ